MALNPMGHLLEHGLEARLLRCALQRHLRSPLFYGPEDLEAWFTTVESACEHCGVPPSQYTDAAIFLINNTSPIVHVMRKLQRIYLERTHEAFWPWDAFKVDIEAEVRRRKGMSLTFSYRRVVLNRTHSYATYNTVGARAHCGHALVSLHPVSVVPRRGGSEGVTITLRICNSRRHNYCLVSGQD